MSEVGLMQAHASLSPGGRERCDLEKRTVGVRKSPLSMAGCEDGGRG